MNKQAFLNLLKNPENLSSKDLEGLEEVIANFPYCQAAQILAAKGANDHGKMLSDVKIRKAAAYSSERATLKKTISKQPAISTEKKIVEETPKIKVQEEVVSKPVEREIPSIPKKEEIKITFVEETEKPVVAESKIISSEPKQKSTNEEFFKELEENLKNLKSLKSQVADKGFPIVKKEFKKEDEVVKENKEIKEDKIKEVQSERREETTELISEPVKQHGEEVNLFSSRLDEVIEEKNITSKPAITEAELLLNYLSFLETHKSSALKDKKKTEEIIEKFIKKDPSIPQLKSSNIPDDQEDKASQSYKLKGGLVSENMANIYALQGKKDRAIEIYQQLMLKSPEKRAYFASQIEKLKGN